MTITHSRPAVLRMRLTQAYGDPLVKLVANLFGSSTTIESMTHASVMTISPMDEETRPAVRRLLYEIAGREPAVFLPVPPQQ